MLDGKPAAFLAPTREGPDLPLQQSILSPHEVDALGHKIAAALDFVERYANSHYVTARGSAGQFQKEARAILPKVLLLRDNKSR